MVSVIGGFVWRLPRYLFLSSENSLATKSLNFDNFNCCLKIFIPIVVIILIVDLGQSRSD